MLLKLTHHHKKLNIIDNFSLFTNHDGGLDEKLGRYDRGTSKPLRTDAIHLGRKGLGILSASIKRSVMHKTGNQSKTRFSGSGGTYASAVRMSATNSNASGSRVSPSNNIAAGTISPNHDSRS